MRHLIRTTVVAIATAAGVLSTRGLHAQQAAAPETDARWYAWLGCWAPDTSAVARGASRSVTCIVPSKSSRGVDALTILRGKITQRNRLEANGRPRPIDGQGCKGTETANWSAAGRRVFLHSDYTCAGGIAGTSATIYALTPANQFVRVERVQSGSGAVVTVDRLHEIDPPALLSADAIRSIDDQQRTIMTARASAAVPIGADEIIEAVRVLDPEVTRSWLITSDQTFDFGIQQLTMLSQAGVPPSILDLVATRVVQILPVQEPARTVIYANDQAPQQPDYPPAPGCPPMGCNYYSAYNGYGYNPVYPYNSYGYLPPFYTLPFVTNVVNRNNNNNNNDGKRGKDGRRDGSNHWNNDGGNHGSNWGQNGGQNGGRNGGGQTGGGNRPGQPTGGGRGAPPPTRAINNSVSGSTGAERYRPAGKAVAPASTTPVTTAPAARRRG